MIEFLGAAEVSMVLTSSLKQLLKQIAFQLKGAAIGFLYSINSPRFWFRWTQTCSPRN